MRTAVPLATHRVSIPLAALVLALGTLAARADDAPWRLVDWKPIVDGPVFEGTGKNTWDREIRERGFILIDDEGTYNLWYTGFDFDKARTISLGRATSPDGLHWTRDPANPIFNKLWTEDVCVVRQDGRYQMFAEGKGDIAHRLSSPDGVHWTDHGSLDIRLTSGEPIPPGPYGTPTGWFEDGLWRLLYERRDVGVWYATSRDMKTWTNAQDEPVLPRGPESYDKAQVAVNQVVRRDGYYYAFYHALADFRDCDWNTCLARSKDLIHWEKYPGNPIIAGNRSSAVLVETPRGDRLYTMHPAVWAFEPAKP